MDPKELRIGNLIYPGNSMHNAEVAEVYGIVGGEVKFFATNALGQKYLVSGLISLSRPVILTEEWLLRGGIRRIKEDHEGEGGFDIPDLDGWPIRLIEHSIGGFSLEVNDEYQIAEIKYVHHLQNIYFDLKGEDLTFSDKQVL